MWLLQSPLMIPTLGIVVTAAAVAHFATTHPADDVNLRALHISDVQMATGASGTITAVAQQLQVKGATGQVALVLPTPASGCQEVAAALHATCTGAEVAAAMPLVAQWTVPQEFVLPTVKADRIELRARPQDIGGGEQLTVDGGGAPQICLRQDPGPAVLSLSEGANVAKLAAPATGLPLCGGLVVNVRSADPSGPSGFSFQGMTSARAMFTGRQMTVEAQSLTLTLLSTSTDTSYDNGPVQIQILSDRQFPVTANWVSPDFASPAGVQAHATSVVEGNAQRLGNALDRYRLQSLIETAATTIAGAAVGFLIWFLARRTGRRSPSQPIEKP